MPSETEPPNAATQEWIATIPTFAKASESHSKSLPDADKKYVEQGSRLVAILLDESNEYWRIMDGAIDGEPLAPHINLIHKQQWKLISPASDNSDGKITTPDAPSHEMIEEWTGILSVSAQSVPLNWIQESSGSFNELPSGIEYPNVQEHNPQPHLVSDVSASPVGDFIQENQQVAKGSRRGFFALFRRKSGNSQ